jgi:amino acid transporter
MTDYDATAHISEEVKRAAIAAPVAIFVAVAGTGLFGFVLNIVLVMCSGNIDANNLGGRSGMIVANILYKNLGPTWFAIVWCVICLNSFSVVLTALQANSRTVFSFSRDGGLPDKGLFSRLSPHKVPVYAIWAVIVVSVLMGLLKFASTVALNAIFRYDPPPLCFFLSSFVFFCLPPRFLKRRVSREIYPLESLMNLCAEILLFARSGGNGLVYVRL